MVANHEITSRERELWPAYSPDLNPIEKLWLILEEIMKARKGSLLLFKGWRRI
jgi:transposase